MARISEGQRVLKVFNSCGEAVRFWFEYLPEIIDKLDNPPIALAYCFQQIESGHRRALYAGLLRKYRLDPDITWKKIDDHEIYLPQFREFYKPVSIKQLKSDTFNLLLAATKTRNKVTHGQVVGKTEIWKAISNCLEYAENFNAQNRDKSGFDVFGRLQGVTSSKAKAMTPEITQLVLKGLGF